MGKIKNIVFDLGGVVVDLDRERAVDTFVSLGVANAAEMLDAYQQKGIYKQLENGTLTASEFCEKLGAYVGRKLTYDEVAAGWLAFIAYVPQYKLDYIQEIRSKYRVYLLSNTNSFTMSWARSVAFSEAGLPVTAYFDKVYASYEMKLLKPDAAIFEAMAKDAGIWPGETLFLDDGKANVETAAGLGFHVYRPQNKEDWRSIIDALD